MENKLRIGVLLESGDIPAWSYKMLEKIHNSNHSQVVLLVRNGNTTNDNSSFLEKIWRTRKKVLWILYNKLDSKLFKTIPDAFQKMNISKLVHCDEIVVTPKRTKFSDFILTEDINKIKLYEIDVFIRLGFRILRGEILKIPKYGIWSYHHGDNAINRGGPAGTWEVFEGWDETGVTLQILSEDLDGGSKLAESFSATEKLSVKRNKNKYYWKALSMLPRKLEQLHSKGPEEFFEKLKEVESLGFYSNRLFVSPTNIQVFEYILKIISRKVSSTFQAMFYFNQWILLYKMNLNNEWSKSFYRFKRITPPKDRFWADPFAIEKNGTYFIFIEELIYTEGRGKISLIEMDKKGNYNMPETIIENDYHMSYPFIFEDNDTLYMIPETSENKTIELYECIDFPKKWKLSKVLFSGISAVDATILKYNGKYWLFCNVKENEGASTLDELFLFYSNSITDGEWISHPCNPIVSDVRQARPAGSIFRENDKLYRPSQNCGKRYGYGLKINEIIQLTTTTYLEKTVESVNPNWSRDILGTHTLNKTSNLTIIDALVKRRK